MNSIILLTLNAHKKCWQMTGCYQVTGTKKLLASTNSLSK